MSRNVVIVGGGFTGSCFAIQLVRSSPKPLTVTIVESSDHLGRGLAYSAVDPDHRLNGHEFAHSILPDDAWHFTRWCQTNRIHEADPYAVRPDGASYIRRGDFGRYLEATVLEHTDWAPTGSKIVHVKDFAVKAKTTNGGYEVTTAAGKIINADMLVVATGNPRLRLPPPLHRSLASHPGVIENALDSKRLGAIPKESKVLLIGSGLTALDVLSTLVRQGHRALVTVISRRGLKPKPQGPMPPVLANIKTPEDLAALPGGLVLGLVMAPVPDFLKAVGDQPTVLGLVKALRARIRKFEAEGNSWYTPFDELRNCVWQVWPKLAPREKQRFVRKMRVWYDVHRFRSPPQNEEMVRAAESQGRIQFIAARLISAAPSITGNKLDVVLKRAGKSTAHQESFDVLVNCTGLDATSGMAENPFLASLSDQGLIRLDACEMGFEVDANCRAVGQDGKPQSSLRIVGPPTLGTFGDPIGAIFIGVQIHRMLKDTVATLNPSVLP